MATTHNPHNPNPSHNPRSPSHAKRPSSSNARGHRPPPLTRRTTPQGIQKVGAGWSKSAERREQEEEAMAASFLQFCATCEKQIIVPNNSILYCSESCRKKDTIKSPTYTLYTSNPSPPLSPYNNLYLDDAPIRDIVPQLSPTERTMPSPFYPSTTSPPPSNHNSPPTSAAHQYLRQFHSASHTPGRQYQPTVSSTATTPSLSHTTPASSASTSTSYSFSTRPLPPRHNPYSASASPRSIDLVTPFTPSAPASLTNAPYAKAPPTSSRPTEGRAHGELLYEKKWTLPSASPSQSSLKQLFHVGERQTRPPVPRWGSR